VPRILLLLPTATYRARDFVEAAGHVGAEVVVGSEAASSLATAMGDRSVVVPLGQLDDAVAAIVDLHSRAPIDAVVAVDDPGVLVATAVAEQLGFPHNPLAAVAATRDKVAMRRALDHAGVAQPRFTVAHDVDDAETAARALGLPVVIKPATLSASRGVIRADDAPAVRVAARRALEICDGRGPLLVEQYVPGAEVALEGILRAGSLETLAVFDKPDPLEGPYFEETIYVTPSRLPEPTQVRICELAAEAAAALGLREGPVHAELRIDGDSAWVIELAARSIGGLCSRALRFGAGISLEEVIVRHALDLPTADLTRERAASGVMMLPIPTAGVLRGVHRQDDARAVPGITGLEITIPPGRTVVPLPEGDRYLGFLFARGETPADVEHALRTAHAALHVEIVA
jgi:biotin carboxylase